MREKYQLSDSDRDKQRKMMDSFEEEIHKLEGLIQNKDKIDKKNQWIKKFKISMNVCRLISPYVLATTIGISFPFLCHDTPFRRNQIECYEYTKTEMDSLGHFSVIEQYEEFPNATSELYRYGEWKLNEDGTYSRDVKRYSLHKRNSLELVKLLYLDEEDDFLGDAHIYTQMDSFVSKEELSLGEYTSITYYEKNKDHSTYRMQTMEEEVENDLIFLCLFCCLELMANTYRNASSYSYLESLKKLEEKYSPLDVEEIQKVLTIKKSNYERLMK